jgi:hypothetical protein
MFDTEGYDLGVSPDIYEYQSFVLTNQKRSITLVRLVFATHTFCETIIHSKGVVVELSYDGPEHSYGTGRGRKEELELGTT